MRSRLALSIATLVPGLLAAQTGGKAPAHQQPAPTHATHATHAAHTAPTGHAARSDALPDTTHRKPAAHERRMHRSRAASHATAHPAAKPDSARANGMGPAMRGTPAKNP